MKSRRLTSMYSSIDSGSPNYAIFDINLHDEKHS